MSQRERESGAATEWQKCAQNAERKVSYLMGSLAAIFHNKIGT